MASETTLASAQADALKTGLPRPMAHHLHIPARRRYGEMATLERDSQGHGRCRVVFAPSYPDDAHAGWEWEDCGCYEGYAWDGPHKGNEVCKQCRGQRMVCRHIATGRLTLKPGGAFVGWW